MIESSECKDEYQLIGMASGFDYSFCINCAVCHLELDELPLEKSVEMGLDWPVAVREDAILKGWKDFRYEEALCPNCDENDFPIKMERDRRSEARKAKAAVLAATRQTLAEKLIRFLQSKFS